jgi:hypothetical protein
VSTTTTAKLTKLTAAAQDYDAAVDTVSRIESRSALNVLLGDCLSDGATVSQIVDALRSAIEDEIPVPDFSVVEEAPYEAPAVSVTVSHEATRHLSYPGESFAVVAGVGVIEVSRADVYSNEGSYIDGGRSTWTITGCFWDNHDVQTVVKAQVEQQGLTGVEFDSELGQFFAYAEDRATAEQVARLAVQAEVDLLTADEAL